MGEIPLFIRVGKHFETICFSQIECCWIHKIKVIWPTRRNFVISLTLVVYRFCNGSPRPAEARQSAHRASILSSEITKDKASAREVGIYLCWPVSTCLCIGSQTRTLQPYAYLWRWKFSFLVCVCIRTGSFPPYLRWWALLWMGTHSHSGTYLPVISNTQNQAQLLRRYPSWGAHDGAHLFVRVVVDESNSN